MNADLILIDGYSVIHAWPELRAKKRRRLALARQEFIRLMAKFSDESGLAVAVVYDGGKAPPPEPIPDTTRGLEVLYSQKGETADDLIERCVGASPTPERLLVITDDGVVRRLCAGFGAQIAGTEDLRQWTAQVSATFEARLSEIHRRGRLPQKSKFQG